MTSSPWKSSEPPQTVNLADIMSEEYAIQELKKYEKKTELELMKQTEQTTIWDNVAGSSSSTTGEQMSYSQAAQTPKDAKNEDDGEWEDCSELLKNEGEELLPPEVLELIKQEDGIDSDVVIAQMLQSQYDHEYNEELRRIEQQRNKQSKVTVTLDKYRRNGDQEFNDDSYEEDEDDEERQKRDWDRFETNEKILDTIPKCGFKVVKDGGSAGGGSIITKHDPQLCGVRNACRVMSFPPEFSTGDAAGFDMKLSNQVFNQLKTFSGRGSGNSKKSKMHDRRENAATAEMGVDERTRVILYKLVNNQVLEQINGVISTGKEAVILHANSDPAYVEGHNVGATGLQPPQLLPKECAIKIFKTTLNEFKQRDRYIKDDYRFKDRFSKQNNRHVINMWAEKEMHNMMRMQSVGINCPSVIMLKQHVLVMSFVGDNHNAAPKLKDARLSVAELSCAYEEIVQAMFKLYNEANLVHADLSEYNILWHADKCWIIDVAQSVEPEHPSALEFLMRDCGNIINFFTKRGLPNIYTKEELFEHITSLDAETHNVAMLERIHTRGASLKQATAPNQEECPDEMKPLNYPFDLAWEKSQLERRKKKGNSTAEALKKCSVEAALNQTEVPVVAVANTAEK